MQTYETYKNSSIDWLGEIPSHWEDKRIKTFSVLKARIGFHGLNSNDFDENAEAYCLTGTDIKSGKVVLSSAYKVSLFWYDLDKNIQIKNGDLLITKDGTIGKVAVVDIINNYTKATLNSGVFVLRSRENPRYLYWSLLSKLFYTQVNLISRGSTINHLYERDFKNFQFLIPPISEQEAIAAFLDEKCGKIDELVSVKEQQIALLKERRQVVIHEAVTKGIQPNVEMKDSGINWISEIPMHWEIKRLKEICNVINGATPDSSNSKYWDGDIVWVTPKDINDIKYISKSERKITLSGYNSCGTRLLCKGSIILTTRAPIGKVCIANIDLCTNQGCKGLELNKKINSEFLFSILLISSKALNSLGTGTTFMELSNNNLKSFEIPIPPLSEQEAIVAYLEEQTGKIDQAIALKTEQIEKLKAYKQSLINEVVTGKVKVA